MSLPKKLFQILLIGIFICLSLPALSNTGSTKCRSLFSGDGEQLSLDFTAPTKRESFEHKFQSLRIGSKPLNTKQVKEQALNQFRHDFENGNLQSMEKLVREFPFLKKVRFTDSTWINSRVKKEHRHWCPEGWSPLQMAVYEKNPAMINKLLDLDFDIRTKKTKGALSLEHNPLHIAIKTDYIEGVELILSQTKVRDYRKRKGHFIDEKNQDKHTAWHLAVWEDVKHLQRNKNILVFTPIVGRYKPSGYVESFDDVIGKPTDGYSAARLTGYPEIIKLAYESLRAPRYETYKYVKERSRNKKRTSPPENYWTPDRLGEFKL